MNNILSSNDLSKIYDIPELADVNYWLIRTEGGQFYDDFKNNNYVSIGWDYINLSLLERLKSEEIDVQRLKQIISEKEGLPINGDTISSKKLTSNRTQVTKILNKIFSFVFDIAIGDIVVCPSRNSNHIAIGVICGEVYEDPAYCPLAISSSDSDEESQFCSFFKRRKVRWLNTVYKGHLDVYLQNTIRPHQAIYPLNDFANIIDRNIYNVYMKNQSLHGIIRTQQKDDLSIEDLKTLIDYIYNSFDQVSSVSGTPIDKNDIHVKINIHCPGILEIAVAGFIGTCMFATVMGGLSHLLYGAKTHIKVGNVEYESSTPGKAGRENEAKRIEVERLKAMQDVLLTDENKEIISKLAHLDLEVPNLVLNEAALDSDENEEETEEC